MDHHRGPAASPAQEAPPGVPDGPSTRPAPARCHSRGVRDGAGAEPATPPHRHRQDRGRRAPAVPSGAERQTPCRRPTGTAGACASRRTVPPVVVTGRRSVRAVPAARDGGPESCAADIRAEGPEAPTGGARTSPRLVGGGGWGRTGHRTRHLRPVAGSSTPTATREVTCLRDPARPSTRGRDDGPPLRETGVRRRRTQASFRPPVTHPGHPPPGPRAGPGRGGNARGPSPAVRERALGGSSAQLDCAFCPT